jgi:hypothetical protein
LKTGRAIFALPLFYIELFSLQEDEVSGRKVPCKPRLVGGVKGDNMNDNPLPGSPALVSGELPIVVDVWLYGTLARYGDEAEQRSFANLKIQLPEESTVADLLARLGILTEERGITFINGRLSAMPGLQPDLGHILHDKDRIGLFDLKSMWPFQYRHGAMLTDEMARAMDTEKDHGLHHTYKK